MTPCDLVFPFFLYIMGLSTYLSLSKTGFKATRTVVWKIVRRTLLLFLIGEGIIWFSHAIGGDLLCFDHLDEADAENYGVTSPLTKSVVLGVSLSF
jgi:predicted acyltransferase